jgi:hypothetical protein
MVNDSININVCFRTVTLEYMYMLSGCELIDTENISLPSQNMQLGGE